MRSRAAERDELLTRGGLAARADCNIETIRYYEQVGLLPPPPRSRGGHRLYGQDLIKRLTFIRRSRDLGFTIEEIRGLLRLVDGRKIHLRGNRGAGDRARRRDPAEDRGPQKAQEGA